ncbi:hypothetical protein D3C76_1774550 [compost metagenome]
MGAGTDLCIDTRAVAVTSGRIRCPGLKADCPVAGSRRIPRIHIFRAVIGRLLPRSPVHPDLYARDRRCRLRLDGDFHLSA